MLRFAYSAISFFQTSLPVLSFVPMIEAGASCFSVHDPLPV